ncbi:hypothetical protein [Vibrio nereis]|uniref:hypothetical protein n=1 Tax=Vibrio nereis TaxID=693 RepID=UPI0024953D57|nr:hypothetical protein [Vibrio nereis]
MMRQISEAMNAAINSNTLIIDSLGFCYLIIRYKSNLQGIEFHFSPESFHSKHKVEQLLRSHSNMWGQPFRISQLYSQVNESPIKNNLSECQKRQEICNKIMSGELVVIRTNNFNTPQ